VAEAAPALATPEPAAPEVAAAQLTVDADVRHLPRPPASAAG
jgi:hypothetical protein